MKIDEGWNVYFERSAKVSDIVRQLGLSAIAVVWIFNPEKNRVEPRLQATLYLIIVALACDLLQYVSASVAWGLHTKFQEHRGVDSNADYEVPNWLNWPATAFWVAKVVLVCIAYWKLILFLRIAVT